MANKKRKRNKKILHGRYAKQWWCVKTWEYPDTPYKVYTTTHHRVLCLMEDHDPSLSVKTIIPLDRAPIGTLFAYGEIK